MGQFRRRLAYFDVDGPIRETPRPRLRSLCARNHANFAAEGITSGRTYPSESPPCNGVRIARRAVMLVAFVVGLRALATLQK